LTATLQGTRCRWSLSNTNGEATASKFGTLAASPVDLLRSGAARAACRPVRRGVRSAVVDRRMRRSRRGVSRHTKTPFRLQPRSPNSKKRVPACRPPCQAAVLAQTHLGSSDSASVYRAVWWLKSAAAFQPPPLHIGDNVYEVRCSSTSTKDVAGDT